MRMTFGLKNAPGSFQTMVDVMLASVKWKFDLVYIDDVIIFSQSIEEDLEQVIAVIRFLKNAGVSLKLENLCLAESAEYLVLVISPRNVKVKNENVRGRRA